MKGDHTGAGGRGQGQQPRGRGSGGGRGQQQHTWTAQQWNDPHNENWEGFHADH